METYHIRRADLKNLYDALLQSQQHYHPDNNRFFKSVMNLKRGVQAQMNIIGTKKFITHIPSPSDTKEVIAFRKEIDKQVDQKHFEKDANGKFKINKNGQPLLLTSEKEYQKDYDKVAAKHPEAIKQIEGGIQKMKGFMSEEIALRYIPVQERDVPALEGWVYETLEFMFTENSKIIHLDE